MSGHTIFIILHIVCVIFGLVGLIITIPAHLIYSAIKGSDGTKESKDVSQE